MYGNSRLVSLLSAFPPGRRCNTGGGRRVVFIQHCLLCSSADYVMNDPDQALGEAAGWYDGVLGFVVIF